MYKEAGLSNITLKWMLDEARSNGLLIKEEVYKKIIPCYKGKIHNSLLLLWWILGWKRRKIEIGSLIHKSVYDRMENVKAITRKTCLQKNA